MSKPDLIVCIPDFDRIPADFHDEARAINATLVDYSGQAKYKRNERMGTEKKVDPDYVDPRYPDAPTHQRMGPWLIEDLSQEVYEGDEYGTSQFEAVHVFSFHYSPLPEEENPWVGIPRIAELPELPDHAKEAMGLAATTA